MQFAAARIGGHRDEAAGLERRGGLTRIREAPADDHVGRRERPRGVAYAHRDHGYVVRLRAGEQARRAGRERVGHRGADGQRIVDHVDQRERVLGDVAVVGDDQRDGLAHVADDLARDRGLQIPLRARRSADPVGNHRAIRHVGGGEHRAHAGQIERALGVDRDQPGMGMARAKHGRVQHAVDADVGDEAARARREAVAADAIVGVTDHRCSSWPAREGARGTVIARRRAEGKRPRRPTPLAPWAILGPLRR